MPKRKLQIQQEPWSDTLRFPVSLWLLLVKNSIHYNKNANCQEMDMDFRSSTFSFNWHSTRSALPVLLPRKIGEDREMLQCDCLISSKQLQVTLRDTLSGRWGRSCHALYGAGALTQSNNIPGSTTHTYASCCWSSKGATWHPLCKCLKSLLLSKRFLDFCIWRHHTDYKVKAHLAAALSFGDVTDVFFPDLVRHDVAMGCEEDLHSVILTETICQKYLMLGLYAHTYRNVWRKTHFTSSKKYLRNFVRKGELDKCTAQDMRAIAVADGEGFCKFIAKQCHQKCNRHWRTSSMKWIITAMWSSCTYNAFIAVKCHFISSSAGPSGFLSYGAFHESNIGDIDTNHL